MSETVDKHINQAKEGNQTAFRFLFNHYWDAIYFYMYKKTANEDEAEDITVKTFAKAFDKINTFNEAYSFKSWLMAISKNLYIDHLRKQKKNTISIDKDNKEAYFLLDESLSPEDKIIAEQNLIVLLACIKKLKPHYQEIINLRYFKEYAYREIATELNEPINTVKVKLLRARKLLAEIIQEK